MIGLYNGAGVNFMRALLSWGIVNAVYEKFGRLFPDCTVCSEFWFPEMGSILKRPFIHSRGILKSSHVIGKRALSSVTCRNLLRLLQKKWVGERWRMCIQWKRRSRTVILRRKRKKS